jgi:hypothetical protein
MQATRSFRDDNPCLSVLEGKARRSFGKPGELLAHLRDCEALPALDRAERDRQLGSDLGLGQPLEVGQLDHPALLRRKADQRLPGVAPFLEDGHLLVCALFRFEPSGWRFVDLDAVLMPSFPPQPVDASAAHHREQPRSDRAAAGVVGAGASPQAEEGVLGGLFGRSLARGDVQREPEDLSAMTVVNRLEGPNVAVHDADHQVAILKCPSAWVDHTVHCTAFV